MRDETKQKYVYNSQGQDKEKTVCEKVISKLKIAFQMIDLYQQIPLFIQYYIGAR